MDVWRSDWYKELSLPSHAHTETNTGIKRTFVNSIKSLTKRPRTVHLQSKWHANNSNIEKRTGKKLWWDEAFIWSARATNLFHESGETKAQTIAVHTVDFVTRINKHARQASRAHFPPSGSIISSRFDTQQCRCFFKSLTTTNVYFQFLYWDLNSIAFPFSLIHFFLRSLLLLALFPFHPLNKLHSSCCRSDAREFCVPTGKLCVQYCANVERYAQN